MEIKTSTTVEELGVVAGNDSAEAIRAAIAANGKANIIVATGASQFETLKTLTKAEGIDWSVVTVFHLDEYLGVSDQHNASFRKYLQERFVDELPGPLAKMHFVVGDAADAEAETLRLGELIKQHPIDVALIGIGENGHVAFNDPPADFETAKPYLVVTLDEACRKQQMGEGWFATIDDVPAQAISMSIQQILKSKCIICSVPDQRKAEAVRSCVEHELSNMEPATILRQHDNCILYIDAASASLLATANES
ncbi:MAG: glucosamine-6-phosphate deaminase [Planctomycetes bacterium]|nr:glucosamine-6-phosphate deaminase [Planctomycetota bacterium]